MKWNAEWLNILGLNKTEVLILEAISTAKNVLAIASETKLSRAGIKYSLDNLMAKDLVSPIRHGKRMLYMAIAEHELHKKLQETIDNLFIDSGTKKGVRIRTSLQNEFIVHVGIKEIIPAYERITSISKGERVKAIQSSKSWKDLLEKFSSKQLVRFNQAIIDNKIITDGILQRNAYKLYGEILKQDSQNLKESAQSLIGRMADYTFVPEQFFNEHAEIWLFKNTTLIVNWNEEVAIEITNADMTKFLSDMFEFVKMGGTKVDHNQAMRELIEL
jgi:DNA-binding MarR family transcriptional regulator